MNTLSNLAILVNPWTRKPELYNVQDIKAVAEHNKGVLVSLNMKESNFELTPLQNKTLAGYEITKKTFYESLVSEVPHVGSYQCTRVVEDDLGVGNIFAIYNTIKRTAAVFTVLKIRTGVAKFSLSKYKLLALNGHIKNTNTLRSGSIKESPHYLSQMVPVEEVYVLDKRSIDEKTNYTEGIFSVPYSCVVRS